MRNLARWNFFAPPRPRAGQPSMIDMLVPPSPAPLPGVLATIDFAEHGNGAAHRLEGWSFQEPGLVWATGTTSTLRWPEAARCSSVVLEMDLLPCLLPPYRTVQRLYVRAGGKVLAHADVSQEGTVILRLPGDFVADAIRTLTLHHPDAIVPNEVGRNTDGRALAIGFRRIAVRGHALPPADASLALPDNELIAHFQSLGGTGQGCEFGLLQRAMGSEPTALLRWSKMTPEALADALEQDFDGVGTQDQTILDYFDWPTHREYRTEDRRFLMSMHTWIKEADKPYDAAFKTLCQRLRFLKGKLLEDLAAADRIFVFKTGDRICTPEQIGRIHRALRRHGRNTLLYVKTADADHAPGTAEPAGEGLILGYVSQFNETADGEARPLAVECWREVCRIAYEHWKTKEAVLF